MSEYVLSCCSTVDLTKEHLDSRDIKYACFHYELDGKQYLDDLGQSMPLPDLYKAMADGAMTKTSQINAEAYETYFRPFLEQGRDVFAIPGDIVRSSFDGTNHLIKNGAKPVFSAEDILIEYESLYGDLFDIAKSRVPLSAVEYVEYRKKKTGNVRSAKPDKKSAEEIINPPVERKELPEYISEEAKCVYAVLNEKETHIDDIVRKTDLKMNVVLSSLTELELSGFAELVSGKKYRII